MIQKKWYQGSRTRLTDVPDVFFFGDLKIQIKSLNLTPDLINGRNFMQLVLLGHTKVTDYSIWNRKICLFEVFSFDHLNDLVDYFIEILEKLSTDLLIIINFYEHEKVAENRLINKSPKVDYARFSQKNSYTYFS